jgi:hypothetical protein
MNKLFKLAGVSAVAVSAAFYASSVTKAPAADITQSSDLDGFSKIRLSTSSDMNITIGNGFSIEMVGDDELIGNTILEVKGDTLHVKYKRGRFNYDDDQEMVINVVMPNIEAMQINGSGDAEITGVDNKELELSINGSGDLNVSGKTEKLDININGSGDIEMEEVAGNDVKININGSGDVIFAGGTCQSIEIEINGSGNVDARQVECQDADVDLSGSGDSIVYASNQIVFDSQGSGEVEVYGKPKTVIDKEARRRSKINIH